MTTKEALLFITNKQFQVNGKFYQFDPNGQMIITSSEDPIYGKYSIIFKDGNSYLRTDPTIINGNSELIMNVVLRPVDGMSNGIILEG